MKPVLKTIYKCLIFCMTFFVGQKDFIAQSDDDVIVGAPHVITTKKTMGLSSVKKKKIIPTSNVSIVKGHDPYAMTQHAIELIGGMKTIVKPGDTVFIKPNYITGGLDGHDPIISGEATHPAVVAAVAEECVKAGARQVTIGEWVERPLKINFGGKEGKEGAQVKGLIDALNKKYGHKISLINLMDHTSYFQFIPSQTPLKYLGIPNVVSEADVVISIPSLKTHHEPSPVSLGMKNFMGIMPSVLYGEPRYKLHQAGLHQVLIDINKGIDTDLVVVDGTFGMEGPGASLFLGGKPVDVHSRIGSFLVLAGFDPVATDATATRLISKGWGPVPVGDGLGTPWYVHHLRMAYEQGLGEINSNKINIVGETLDSVSMSWEPSNDGVYPEKPEDVL